MKRDGGEKFFEFFDFEKFPNEPPPEGSEEYFLVPILKMMPTAEQKTGIKWTRQSTKENPTKRAKRVTWEWVTKDNEECDSGY